MKVLHLIAPVRFGGGESLLVNLTSERRPSLAEAVVCVYNSPEFRVALTAACVQPSALITATHGAGLSRRRLLLDAWRWPVLAARLVGWLARFRPDVVHVHGFPAIGLWAAVRVLRPLPALYTHHFVRSPPGEAERRVLGAAYRSCAVRTGVSDVVSRSMEAAFPEAGPFVTVPNCIGERFFSASPTAEVLALRPSRGAVVLQPARFSPFKNQRRVVEALERLGAAERDALTVWFAGDGPERAAVEARAAELGVTAHVRFLGHVPYEAMPAYVAAADFGLFPSDTEGFGIGAVECQAAGKPVLANDNALMREVLGGGAVFANLDDLDHGLRALVRRGPALVDAARASAARFRPAAVKDAYLALYEDAVRGEAA